MPSPPLGPTQTLVLRALAEIGERPMIATAIVARHNVSLSRVMAALRWLEDNRLVRCSYVSDFACWSLTDDGRRAVEEMS